MRIYSVAALGLLSVAASYGGAIEIGGPTGLTSNYINQGAGAVCAAGAGNCVTGSISGYVEGNYDTVLFSGATNSSSATPTPFTGYNTNAATPSGSTMTGVLTGSVATTTFAMLSDGTAVSGVSNNYWGSNGTNGATDTLTIPIGVYDATDVWTMLDNQWGTLGGNDTTITFNFGVASNQTSGYLSIPVALNNNDGTALNGQLQASVSCTTAATVPPAQSSPNCNAGTNPRGTTANSSVINGVTVNTGVDYSFIYTAATGVYYGGSAGKVKLDDQEFVFNNPLLSDLWLVSVTVTENDANTPESAKTLGGSTLPSETAISAITVDGISATPEPGTVMLFLTGLGGLGFLRFRRS